jgi:hypothetical protein
MLVKAIATVNSDLLAGPVDLLRVVGRRSMTIGQTPGELIDDSAEAAGV